MSNRKGPHRWYSVPKCLIMSFLGTQRGTGRHMGCEREWRLARWGWISSCVSACAREGKVIERGEGKDVEIEKETLRDRMRLRAEQEAWARVLWGREKDVRQQMIPIRHTGRFLQGVRDPCFCDSENTGLSSVITYAVCLCLSAAIYLQSNLFSPSSSAKNSITLNSYSYRGCVCFTIHRQTR